MKKWVRPGLLLLIVLPVLVSVSYHADTKRQAAPNPDNNANETVDDWRFFMVPVKQEYREFLRQMMPDGWLSVVYFVTEDLDHDGLEEAIVGFGPASDSILEVYVLQNRNGEIRRLGDNIHFDRRNYPRVHRIDLIHLEDLPGWHIHLFLKRSDGKPGGFSIVSMTEGMPRHFFTSAPLGGTGYDMLLDKDVDGKYDGYVSIRDSQVELYPYSTTYDYYKLENGFFQFERTEVDLDPYPALPEDVVFQYMLLSMQDLSSMPVVKQRLADLCAFCAIHSGIYVANNWSTAIHRYFTKTGDSLAVSADIHNNKAKVTVSTIDNDLRAGKMEFELSKTENRWTIAGIVTPEERIRSVQPQTVAAWRTDLYGIFHGGEHAGPLTMTCINSRKTALMYSATAN